MAQILTEHDGSQRLGLRAWIAALDAAPADLKPEPGQIQVSGDIQKSMGTSGIATITIHPFTRNAFPGGDEGIS